MASDSEAAPEVAPHVAPEAATPGGQPSPRKRLPLGASNRRLSYEKRIRLWLFALTAPSIVAIGVLTYLHTESPFSALAATVTAAVVIAIAAAYFFEQLVRPLQTLANVVAALREDDFSFRARGARRGDSLGDLALEINALASTLQTQRAAARDALTLVERVINSMQSPVLAFDAMGALRLLNPAAADAFRLTRRLAIGRPAEELGLAALLNTSDEDLYTTPGSRFSIRRTTFRLHGIPHTLFVLADVAAALREEERVAWQRLIRVLSHEINNSLTPIKSLAGSLRTGLSTNAHNPEDLHRGLTVIEDRAASLNRFLQAYQQLTRLPAPALRPISLCDVVSAVVPLETRLAVTLQPGPETLLLADPDQLQQLLINLIRNAVEAALANPAVTPHVLITWSKTPTQAILQIIDSGPGLLNPSNLFVPFYTTKPEGSGIGLVLAQQIASAHKGSITLTNNPIPPGCTAELRLPLKQLLAVSS
jgi:nitrogen fixation/metabolism regulation signal transduction histidine kinase